MVRHTVDVWLQEHTIFAKCGLNSIFQDEFCLSLVILLLFLSNVQHLLQMPLSNPLQMYTLL
jgi:hypothetical protein